MYGNKPAIETIDSTKEECLRLYTNYFTRMRFCNQLGEIELIHKGKPFDPPEGFKPWFKHKLSIMNDKSIMGKYSNSTLVNVLGLIIIGVTLVLGLKKILSATDLL